jgi:hypothetical protein
VVIVTTIGKMRCVPGHHLRYCKQTADHAVLVEKTEAGERNLGREDRLPVMLNNPRPDAKGDPILRQRLLHATTGGPEPLEEGAPNFGVCRSDFGVKALIRESEQKGVLCCCVCSSRNRVERHLGVEF